MFKKLIYDECYNEISKSLEIIRKNKNYSIISRELDRIYFIIKKYSCFFYDKEYENMDDLYYNLIEEVYELENSVPNYFILPIKEGFVYRRNRDIRHKESVDILDWLIYETRCKYVEKDLYFCEDIIDLSNETLENKCEEITKMFLKVCNNNGIMCKLFKITPGFANDNSMHEGYDYHYVAIVMLRGVEYLVDLSYKQFFTLRGNSFERIGVAGLNNSRVGKFMLLNSKRMELANRMIIRGWIPLLSAKEYFDGFVLFYRNIHYYEDTKDYSFDVSYTMENYMDFILEKDNQVIHEGKRVLDIQKRPSKLSLK